MQDMQLNLLEKSRSMVEELTRMQQKYWESFSSYETWQFWVQVLIMVISLIGLLILIDQNKALLLGFFGLNYHVWFGYTNTIGIKLGMWEYPYHVIPQLPSLYLDAVLIPVLFILLYQWTLNHKKNIYLYAVLLSAILAFVLKPIMVKVHFFHMFNGVNYVHLFLMYMLFFIVSKLITNLFVWLQKRSEYH